MRITSDFETKLQQKDAFIESLQKNLTLSARKRGVYFSDFC